MTNTKPFISIIVPCYNEEAILKKNIEKIVEYLENKNEKYKWELLIINDGSKDKTGRLAICEKVRSIFCDFNSISFWPSLFLEI